MLKKLVTIVSFALVSSSLFAVSLQNKDSKSYNIKIKGSSSTSTGSINGGTSRGSVCKKCTITVDGVGSIDASGSDSVVIKGGKISK